MIQLTDKELAKKIQHTNVNPELTEQDILSLCKDCVDYGFDGVMLQPAWGSHGSRLPQRHRCKGMHGTRLPHGRRARPCQGLSG